MLLKSARINNFRCIDDSTEFSLHNVTCLVGKNESGKTAILKALYRIKPDNEKEIFKLAIDYPKREWKPSLPIPDDPIITTVWQLESIDKQSIDTYFGKDVLVSDTVKVMKGYENDRSYVVEVNEQKFVKHLIEKYQIKLDGESSISSLDLLKSYIIGLEQKSAEQNELLGKLTKEFCNGLESAVINYIDDLLPTFLYFDQYTRLPGNVSITEFNDKRARGVLNDNDRIFLALMALAGTDIDSISNAKTFEEFNSSMKAISNQISDQIFGYWTQNKHLDVELKFDMARAGDPPPFNTGYVFRTRINNRRHRADTSFDERSSGFVWFFSFLVYFQQLKETYKKKLIILLDEPGLTLHSRAQSDLLRYFNEKLKPDYQIVYTTHSPFMIDTDNILSARTVEDVVTYDKKTREEKLEGTKVSEKVLSSDQDTVSPLQKALDYELTQSLFIGKNNILVEGPSDYLYLKWFSQILEKNGKTGLDYRWTISIVGGIDKIPGYVSLFNANLLHIVALIDVQSGHKQKIENLRKTLRDKHLILTTDYSTKKEADLEDVFGNEFYISLINEAYRLQNGFEIKENIISSQTTNRIINDIEAYFRTLPASVQEYDHFFPSQYLYEQANVERLKGVEEALENMEKLISVVNSLLK